MNVVSGLHEYLSDDREIANAASARNVTIRDIRKPKPSKDMRLFDGSVSDVKALRIALLGTDCAIGKRTTATVLARALNAKGIKTVLVGTGQTGLMQGAKYGVAMDAVPPQFCCGELESCATLQKWQTPAVPNQATLRAAVPVRAIVSIWGIVDPVMNPSDGSISVPFGLLRHSLG